MIAGTLEIQMMANLARLTQDMNQAKSTVNTAMNNISASVDIAKKALGALGVGLSVNAFAGYIKASINAADETAKLAQKINVATHEIAGLELAYKLAGLEGDTLKKSIATLSKNVADGNPVLAKMGINVKDLEGNLRPTRQILADVSDRFAGYADNANKTRLAQELFGSKLGTDLIPMLNQGSQALLEMDRMAEKLGLTISAETAAKSERFNDTLSLMGMGMQGISRRIVAEMIPTFTGLADQFFNTMSEGVRLKTIADALSTALKGLVAVGIGVAGTFSTIGTGIGGVAAMWSSILSRDFDAAAFIAKQVKKDVLDGFSGTLEKMRDAWNASGSASLDAMTETNKQLRIQAPLVKTVTDEVQKSTVAKEKQNRAFDAELYKLKQYEADAKRARDITESVATKQEKYNRALEELQRLKPYLEVETYNRKLQALQAELTDVGSTQRTVVNEMDQLWIQAGRNIQNTLGNAVFDFFSGGMENMVVNAKNAVLRIASEFAGLRIAQGLGLTAMFAAPGAAAAASGGTGGGLGLLNMASLGTSALSLLKGGFGINAGVGGLLSVLGGNSAVGAFGAGMAGGAIPGVSSAVTMAGSSFASILGPVAALGGIDMIGRMLAGDRKLGGAEMIPVIGGFLAAMFGREPYKFRQQSLQGTVSSGGFDGDITNVFRSKGGLFMGNKHKSVTEQFSPEMQALFDSTIGGFFDTVRAASLNLGIDAALVENFTKEIQIKSEKGQKLTEQAITDMLTGIGEDLAKAAMPIVDTYKKVGETSIQTLSRLSSEFVTLTSAASLLFDKSSEWSKGFINSFGFGDRTAFLDKAGGTDAFSAMVAGFAQNFLTDDQRMRPVIESLVSQRNALGLGNINTRAQYVSAVQGGMLNQDQLLFLLKNQDAIKGVFDFLDAKLNQTSQALQNTANAAGRAALALNVRNIDETEYGQRLNAGIQQTTAAISQLEDIAQQLRGTVNSINPMTIEQARRIVSSGNINDPMLQTALSTLGGMGMDKFSNVIDFQRAKGRNAAAVMGLQGAVDGQIVQKNFQLQSLMNEKDAFRAALERAASMYMSEVASFDTGISSVPRTGLAMIHKNERIINSEQNADLTTLLEKLIEKVSKNADSSAELLRKINNVMVETDDGMALRQSTAA